MKRSLAFLFLTLFCAAPHAARAQTIVLSGPHDNSPNPPGTGDGYNTAPEYSGEYESNYLVPAGATFSNNHSSNQIANGLNASYNYSYYYFANPSITVSGGTFSNNDYCGIIDWADSGVSNPLTINGGTFSHNQTGVEAYFGVNNVVVTGGEFSDNGWGLDTSGFNVFVSGGTFSSNSNAGVSISTGTAFITGGTFSGNGKSFIGLDAYNANVVVRGGVFSGNEVDFYVQNDEAGHTFDVYGAFDGVAVGKTKTLTIKQDASQSFYGQLQYAASPQTFIYTGGSSNKIPVTITLHGVAPSLAIVTLRLNDQSSGMPNIPVTTLPFVFGSSPTDSDTVHWATSPVPAGTTLHWQVTPPSGGSFTVGKSSGSGPPSDFQITVLGGGSYLYSRRPALSFILEAWETKNTAPSVRVADVKTIVSQNELGQLRQEYADHPLTPAAKDVDGNLIHLKKVPDVSSFVDTTENTFLDRYNHGEKAGTWSSGTAGSQWADVTNWMLGFDAEMGGISGENKINSAWRGPVYYYNIAGGIGKKIATGSQHLWGDAIDYNVSQPRGLQDYSNVAENISYIDKPGQIIWETDTTHVHVQQFFLGSPTAVAVGLDIAKHAKKDNKGNDISGYKSKTIYVNSYVDCLAVLSQTGSEDTTVTLTSSNPRYALLSSNDSPTPSATITLTVPANNLTAPFSIFTYDTTPPLTVPVTATVTMKAGGKSATGTLTVNPQPPTQRSTNVAPSH